MKLDPNVPSCTRAVNRFWIDGFGLKLKRAWIVDSCSKSSRFSDFENTVDRGSAVIFDADSGLC